MPRHRVTRRAGPLHDAMRAPLLALLAALPLAVHTPYALGLLTLLPIYGVLLIGLDVSVGYLGQINLGQVE